MKLHPMTPYSCIFHAFRASTSWVIPSSSASLGWSLFHLDQWNLILGADPEENSTPGGCFRGRTTSEVVQAFSFHINLPFNKLEPLIGGAFHLRHHFCFPSAGHQVSLQRHWSPEPLQLCCCLHPSPSKCLTLLAHLFSPNKLSHWLSIQFHSGSQETEEWSQVLGQNITGMVPPSSWWSISSLIPHEQEPPFPTFLLALLSSKHIPALSLELCYQDAITFVAQSLKHCGHNAFPKLKPTVRFITAVIPLPGSLFSLHSSSCYGEKKKLWEKQFTA